MNSKHFIRYFDQIGWSLSLLEGRKRGAWLLSSDHSGGKNFQFSSLKALWLWWRERVRAAATDQEAIQVALEIYQNSDEKEAALLRKWIISGGMVELPENLFVALNLPYFVDQKLERWRSMAPKLAKSCGEVSQENYFMKLQDRLIALDRCDLAQNLPQARQEASPRLRL